VIPFGLLLSFEMNEAYRAKPWEETGMPVLPVVLSEQHNALIADLVEAGQFRSADEVLQEGLRLLEAERKQDAQKQEKMGQAIQAGLEDLDQGRFLTLGDSAEVGRHIKSLGDRVAERQGQAGH
jgi:antitoxin ParD1/3/4